MTSTASKTSTVSETSTASETSTVSQTTSTHQAPTASNHSGTPNFRRSVALALANQRLGLAMDRATRRQDNARRTAMPELPDPMAARKLAARIKDHTLQNLDKYLAQLADNFRKHGGHVHFAHTAEQAT
ncbi:MAG: hypothetical protein WBL15_16505, partial [Phycisphaerae bacterium]